MITAPQNSKDQRLVYKSVAGRDIELLFYPPLKKLFKRAPLLIIIPGGGWRTSDALSMYNMERKACETLQNEGFAVASLSYRNANDDGATMRQIVSDILDAAGYLCRFSDTLEIDTDRFYTSGHSAGGHLSLLLAYLPCNYLEDERDCAGYKYIIRATAPMSPPTMLSKDKPLEYMNFDTDYLFCERPDDEYEMFSPEIIVNQINAVPTLVSVGSKDELVYPSNGIRLFDKLTQLGIKAGLIVSEGGGHCFEPIGTDVSDPPLADILTRISDFLLAVNREA